MFAQNWEKVQHFGVTWRQLMNHIVLVGIQVEVFTEGFPVSVSQEWFGSDLPPCGYTLSTSWRKVHKRVYEQQRTVGGYYLICRLLYSCCSLSIFAETRVRCPVDSYGRDRKRGEKTSRDFFFQEFTPDLRHRRRARKRMRSFCSKTTSIQAETEEINLWAPSFHI